MEIVKFIGESMNFFRIQLLYANKTVIKCREWLITLIEMNCIPESLTACWVCIL